MTVLEQLNLIKDERYVTGDGEEFGIILRDGLSDDQIDQLAARLPGAHIPREIRELLRFTSGFSFAGLDGISFDGVDQFGFENIFPASVQLAGDGAGNFWVVDVGPTGEWGPVFFVCHDPAVVVKQSEDLVEYLQQIDELGKKPDQSTLSVFLDRTMMRIHGQDDGFTDMASARSSTDLVLREFAAGLPDRFVVADLRDVPIQTGFAWGKYGPDIGSAVRHEKELLWGFETENRQHMNKPGILSTIGRIFYGASIAAIGVLTMIYRDVPYMMLPPKHVWLTDHLIVVYTAGALLLLAGAFIAIGRKLVPVSLLLGTALLLIFCFYFVPYELTISKNYKHFGDWENSAKELAFAGGAFAMASPALRKLARLGAVLFALTIISFGIDHFLYAKEAQDYIPAWIPNHLFWMYPTGAALLGSGIAILLRIRVRLFATLLGSMIFIWVVILHIPKASAAGFSDSGGEVTSLFLALAYCGTAFVIAGDKKNA